MAKASVTQANNGCLQLLGESFVLLASALVASRLKHLMLTCLQSILVVVKL